MINQSSRSNGISTMTRSGESAQSVQADQHTTLCSASPPVRCYIETSAAVSIRSFCIDVLEAGARPPIILTEVKSIDLLKIAARIKRGDGQAADGWNCYAEVRPQVKPGYMRTILLSTKRYVALAVVVGSEIRLRQCDPFAGVDGFDVARDVFDYGKCIEYWQWISDPTGETEDGYTERVETPDSGASPDSDATE